MQRALNYFDEKIHQLEDQIYLIHEEIRYWEHNLEGLMAKKKLRYENNMA